MKYIEAFKESIEHPETFWGRAAEEITWYRKWVGSLHRKRLLKRSSFPSIR